MEQSEKGQAMTNQPNDGGPVFPNTTALPNLGMTLRDYFAAAALTGLLSNPAEVANWVSFADGAYECADAMLKAKEAKP